ncbi:MAG: thiamine-phosphate kinase [SAR202 cluster bacterium]|nr:thiamine-phosphate kinase [SAR202 cluster bacterium]
MTTVRDIGEFGLIDRIARRIADAHLRPPAYEEFKLRIGIGDDAAAWQLTGGIEVCTTDTMVEGTHFRSDTLSWGDVGWKLAAANISDIGAMGGIPLCAVVTMGLPATLPTASVDDLYDGMLAAMNAYRALLVGGDIVNSPVAFVSMTLTGVCVGEPMIRTAARPGHVIGVTGPLGASGGGLWLLLQGEATETPSAQALLAAHRRPAPTLEDGRRLSYGGVRCAMDISDGLVADLGKLTKASRIGAVIRADRVPVAPALSEALPEEAARLALTGGEDYEVVFTAPREIAARLLPELPRATLIGEVTAEEPGTVRVLDARGQPVPLSSHGWEHLR